MLINALQDYLDALPKTKSANGANDLNSLKTERFFESLNLKEYTKNQVKLIEVFCKKIEVSKRLYAYYDAKTFKPYSNKEISHDVFCRIICHLMGVYLYTKDHKFLNTVLKTSSSEASADYWYLPLPLKIMCGNLLDDV